jgi:hypothetical protein
MDYNLELLEQKKWSQKIFSAVLASEPENYKEAEKMVVLFWVPDKEVSRGGISDALNRLKRHFKI